MRLFLRPLAGLVLVIAAIYVFNASWRVAPPPGDLQLIAHRGVHQTFDNKGLSKDGCSATRIYPPTSDYLENTLPSMRAAFEAGADIVEFDVHPTTDGHFAVLHDWTVDCRTEGTGVTREHSLAELKALDIGYGYTADNGASFPFRGKGVGMLPEASEVFEAFPDGRFLVNFKSREAREGDMLADLLDRHPAWRQEVWGVYGGAEPTLRAAELLGPNAPDGPRLAAFTNGGVKDCLLGYLATGWLGIIPDACHQTVVMVPINLAWLAWGWPNLFLQRMKSVGSEVILLGEFEAGDPGTTGIDDAAAFAQVPNPFPAYVWTNRIEVIGPLAKARR